MKEHSKRYLPLAGIDTSLLTIEELRSLARGLIEAKIFGVAFSAYVEDQAPGTELGEAQIRERLNIIQPYVHWIRSFSCREGNLAARSH